MNRKAIVFVILLMLGGAGWWFRGSLAALWSKSPAAAEEHAGIDHSGHDMSASQSQAASPAADDPHAGHVMPEAGAQESQAPAAAAQAQGERKVLYWYDPMHPAYRSDKPGTAPDCGMALVPKYADEAAALADMPAGTVMLNQERQQLIGVRTAEVRRERLTRKIRTVATITADETRLSHAHMKVEGWIEEVFVDYVGAYVKRGQPLFTLYSPELLSAQQELLIAAKARRELADSPTPEIARSTEALYRAAFERLRLWDMSDAQIHHLEETGQPERTVTFFAEHDGFVTERKALPQMRVEKNTDLYTLIDLSHVWAIADIYEFEAPLVKVGQTAVMKLSYAAGKTFTGKVTYVYPTVDPKTRTVKVRLEFSNPNFELKPDMYADLELQVDYGMQTTVPAEAVLDSGLRQVVFLARPGGAFVPREVRLGARLEDRYIVISGLQPGETVVTSGNFLIDSESRLSSATGGMSHQYEKEQP